MATGRKQVAPRQTIASQWGNWVWDQSIQTFATLNDRNTQFPSPPRGACCAIDDHPGMLFMWDGARWMTEVAANVAVTTNGFGSAVVPLAFPFGVRPTVQFTVEAAAPPYDFFATIDQTNTASTQLTALIRAMSNNTAVANTAVSLHYWARGPM